VQINTTQKQASKSFLILPAFAGLEPLLCFPDRVNNKPDTGSGLDKQITHKEKQSSRSNTRSDAKTNTCTNYVSSANACSPTPALCTLNKATP
jgi:hypothetical protein